MTQYFMQGVEQELHVIDMADKGDEIADLALRKYYVETVSDGELPRVLVAAYIIRVLWRSK